MLDSYMGEFLISPIPMELSLHYCSMSCPYCFANLNNRRRRADVPALLRLIEGFEERKTLVAHWLQAGYPICFSNRVDPFATSNIRDSLALIEAANRRGLRLQFQTRGAHERHTAAMYEVIATLPYPAVWYLTIEMWDDAIRQQVAPAAPSIPSRWELVARLLSAGHTVVVGVNPVVEEWLPSHDVARLMAVLKAFGVHGVWAERLHFSRRQVAAMSAREKAALGEAVIGRARERVIDPTDWVALNGVRQAALDAGLEVFSVGQPNRSNFFAPYHELYRTIPTMQDFINWCHDHLEGGAWIAWEAFRDFFVPHLPAGTWPIDAYLGATTHQLWRTHHVAPQMSYEQLLAIIWQEPRYKMCPARLPSFAYAAVETAAGWVRLTDEAGRPYLIWSPEGTHQHYHVHCETAAGAVLEEV